MSLSVQVRTLAGMRFNPWRHLAATHPGLHVDCRADLRPGRMGAWLTTGEVALSRLLGQAERRCTITHETVHVERGPVSTDPRLAAREEAVVDEIAARRLIPLDDLIDAIRWGQGNPDCEELWVDLPTLQARVRTLTEAEQAQISEALA